MAGPIIVCWNCTVLLERTRFSIGQKNFAGPSIVSMELTVPKGISICFFGLLLPKQVLEHFHGPFLMGLGHAPSHDPFVPYRFPALKAGLMFQAHQCLLSGAMVH